MNRRKFLQSVAALVTLPAMPSFSFSSAAATTQAASAAIAVPAQARSWAVYISTLHGECNPQTLQNLLHIPNSEANAYVNQLVADGLLKPNPMMTSRVSNIVKDKKDNLLEKIKERFEMKSEARTEERVKTFEPADTIEADEVTERAESNQFDDVEFTDPDAGEVKEAVEIEADMELVANHATQPEVVPANHLPISK